MFDIELFAGAGGGCIAHKWLSGRKIGGYVEWDDYCQRIIAARIKDGLLDEAPIFGDINTFISEGYAAGYTGLVSALCAGFPCQPFAPSGKRLGEDDPRDGWPATLRCVEIIQPQFVFLENSVKLLSPFRAMGKPAYVGRVLGDLAAAGYDAEWGVLSAADMGMSHTRERVWIAAYTSSQGRQELLRRIAGVSTKAEEGRPSNALDAILSHVPRIEKRLGEPGVFGSDDGMANRVDRLAALGNGQVPIVAATAWDLLTQG